ncbi:MAG TPA: tetratricopeptide repeat protein [Flavobacteriales bacterium]|nr:tetratricopeptide repeat protein [Flavobacteriales bacterium]
MQRLFPSALLLLVGTSAFAQQGYKKVHNQMLDQAKVLLANEDYEEASKIYKRLLPVDPLFVEVFHEMGVCMANMPGQKDKAVTYFERGVEGRYTESYYELALARHRQQRFDEAVELFEQYKLANGRIVPDAEVDRRKAMALSAKALTAVPVELEIKNMGAMVNSSAHDYCPLVTADGNTMYFTSRREGTSGNMKDPFGQWFEDIYTAKRIDDAWTNAVNAGTPLNTLVHDATVGLSPDGSSMIIYRTQQNLVSGDLFEARMHARKWQQPEMMTERINSESHEPSASIAPGAQEIYFTSDRPGGFGGRDIYRIRRLPNGEWSLPLNLGPNVNTMHDEDAPFMHSDGTTLFFCSNGHNTMGGYDIFKTVLTDPDMNGWGTPENMGYPLNTVNDDIYFCLSEDGRTGYFSSERSEGLGMQDIYQVTFPNSQLDHMIVRGIVADAGDEPVKARMILTDATGEEIVGIYNSNERTGRYLMVLTPDQEYRLTVEAPGFAPQASTLVARMQDGSREMALDFVLQPPNVRDGLTRNE